MYCVADADVVVTNLDIRNGLIEMNKAKCINLYRHIELNWNYNLWYLKVVRKNERAHMFASAYNRDTRKLNLWNLKMIATGND